MASVSKEDRDGNPFDSEYVYTHYSQTIPVFSPDEKEGPGLLAEAVSYAVAAEKDIVTEILKETGYKSKMASFLDAYYTYGKDEHPYGLPSFIQETTKFLLSYNDAKSILQTRFSITESDILNLDYYYSSDIYPEVTNSNGVLVLRESGQDILENLVLIRVQHTLGYNAYSSTVNTILANTVFGLSIPTTNTDTAAVLSIEHSIAPSESTGELESSIVVRFALSYTDAFGNAYVTSTASPFVVDSTISGYAVFIFNNSAGNKVKYVYPMDTAFRNYYYPEITLETTYSDVGSDLYPMMPIKLYWWAVNEEFSKKSIENKDLYLKTKALSRKLGIELKTLENSLKGNVNYPDIHSAYLLIGANFNSQNKYELSYIFDYFTDPEVTGNILGGANKNNFSLDLYETSVYLSNFHKNFFIQAVTVSTYSGTIPIITAPTLLRTVGVPGAVDSFRVVVKEGSYYLARQVSKSKWVEVTIVGPTSYINVGTGSLASVGVLDLFTGSNELRLPLRKSILNKYPGYVAAEIATRSVCIQLSGVSKTKLDWYETGDFAAFMELVSIALTIAAIITSIPSGGGSFVVKEFLWNLLVTILEAYLAKIVIELAMKLLSPLIGEEAAFVVGVVVVVGIAKSGMDASFTSKAFAMEALTLTNASFGVYNKYTQEEIKEIQEQSAYDLSSIEEKLEKIQDIAKGLNPEELTPYMRGLMIKDRFAYETPDEYFYRTIHVGNPGVKTLGMPGGYVASKIKLPDYTKSNPYELMKV